MLENTQSFLKACSLRKWEIPPTHFCNTVPYKLADRSLEHRTRVGLVKNQYQFDLDFSNRVEYRYSDKGKSNRFICDNVSEITFFYAISVREYTDLCFFSTVLYYIPIVSNDTTLDSGATFTQ